jgi:hypothetical protein
MKESKYLTLDQGSTKKDFPEVYEKYSATHTVTARHGTKIDLTKLEKNQSVVWGDGKTFHFLLTEIKD